MRVIHFTAAGDDQPNSYLAIKQRDDDSEIRIPVYRKEADGVYHQTPIFFPSCTKFMYQIDVKMDRQMTAKDIRKRFGEIKARRRSPSDGHPLPGHGLIRIAFSALDNKQREAYHYHKVCGMLADYGLTCTWLIADWRGADFVAVGLDGTALPIQLKSGGYEINEKYRAYTDLWMLFPNGEDWYFIKHHDLVEIAGRTTNQLQSKAWTETGKYSISSANPKRRIPSQLAESLHPYKIN